MSETPRTESKSCCNHSASSRNSSKHGRATSVFAKSHGTQYGALKSELQTARKCAAKSSDSRCRLQTKREALPAAYTSIARSRMVSRRARSAATVTSALVGGIENGDTSGLADGSVEDGDGKEGDDADTDENENGGD